MRHRKRTALENKVWALETAQEAILKWTHDKITSQQRDLVVLAARVAELESAHTREEGPLIDTLGPRPHYWTHRGQCEHTDYSDVVTVSPVIYDDLSTFGPLGSA